MYDASSYYAGSAMAGNNIRRGDPQLCRELNAEINIHNYQALVATNKTVYEEVQVN